MAVGTNRRRTPAIGGWGGTKMPVLSLTQPLFQSGFIKEKFPSKREFFKKIF